MNKAVIDSNVLVALVDSRDALHSKANRLLEQKRGLIYFDCMLHKTLSVFGRRIFGGRFDQYRRKRCPVFLNNSDRVEEFSADFRTFDLHRECSRFHDIACLILHIRNCEHQCLRMIRILGRQCNRAISRFRRIVGSFTQLIQKHDVEIDLLAAIVRGHFDMPQVYALIREPLRF